MAPDAGGSPPVREVRPLNALPDLDEVLAVLLRRDLASAGIDSVTITFEAPERDRVATWPSPALNLFLYDLRESPRARDRSWRREEGVPGGGMRRAPLRLDCSYAITAWTRAAVDEHRLLSQVLAILLAHPELPAQSDLRVGTPPVPLATRVAHGKEEGRADFWTAIGSPFKVSLEFEVTILVEAAQLPSGGPPVTRAVMGLQGRGPAEESFILGGSVRRSDGSPAAGAAVVVAAAGIAAVVDVRGRFTLSGLGAGSHAGQVRDIDGAVTELRLDVPGPDIEVLL